ncbi:MAG: nucleotidyltransferase family protein [Planctomycetia bacterium]|nr:nucleotidyltransferase family protein [Planctomycetia bacterium]
MTFAVVPACGLSTRMGKPKLALPLGGRTVIEHVVSALREGGVERVLVVIGPHVPELIPLAGAAGAEVLALNEPTPDMRATVERGLSWLEGRYTPKASDWWFLAPADHPAFSSEVVGQLLTAAETHADCSVVVPVHEGRRGHPVLLRWSCVAGIRALPADQGINSFLRLNAAEVREVPVNDPGIHANLDTPEDYARISEREA